VAHAITKIEKEEFEQIRAAEYFIKLWDNDKDTIILHETKNIQKAVARFNMVLTLL
jgi:hypothetical protein